MLDITDEHRRGPAYVVGALVLLAGAVVSQLMAPETTGLELNEAARLSNTGELPAVTG